ncbi:MAG TPA: hypothetical protein VGI95_19050 [Caulobacteraceae bacterium]
MNDKSKPPPNSLEGWAETEAGLVRRAPPRYGDYWENARLFSWLLADFVKSVSVDREMFVRWLSQAKKHQALAVLSTARLHAVQASMDMRQVLESGAYAAYALANPAIDQNVILDDDGLIKKTASKPAYAWLDQNFPAASGQIKAIKDAINETFAHAYLQNTHQNFEWSGDGQMMETPFFDIEDDHLVKTRLWQIANIARGLLDLYYAVRKKHGGFVFRDDFEAIFRTLSQQNDALRDEMMATDRYKAAMATGAAKLSKAKV